MQDHLLRTSGKRKYGFSCTDGTNYQNVTPTSPPMANPLELPSSSHSNPYAIPIHPEADTEPFLIEHLLATASLHYSSQSYNFQDGSSFRCMNSDRIDER